MSISIFILIIVVSITLLLFVIWMSVVDRVVRRDRMEFREE